MSTHVPGFQSFFRIFLHLFVSVVNKMPTTVIEMDKYCIVQFYNTNTAIK